LPSSTAAFPGSGASRSALRPRRRAHQRLRGPAPAYNLPHVGGEGPAFVPERPPGAVPGPVFERGSFGKLSDPETTNRARSAKLSSEARSDMPCRWRRN
jgi:hypothetical protein